MGPRKRQKGCFLNMAPIIVEKLQLLAAAKNVVGCTGMLLECYWHVVHPRFSNLNGL